MTVLIVSFTVQNATETGLPWLLQRINFIYDTKIFLEIQIRNKLY